MEIEKSSDLIWYINDTGACGKFRFEHVVEIQEPLSINPGIACKRPFGLKGLKKAIALLEAERAKYGLTTLKDS